MFCYYHFQQWACYECSVILYQKTQNTFEKKNAWIYTIYIYSNKNLRHIQGIGEGPFHTRGGIRKLVSAWKVPPHNCEKVTPPFCGSKKINPLSIIPKSSMFTLHNSLYLVVRKMLKIAMWKKSNPLFRKSEKSQPLKGEKVTPL